MTFKIGDTVKLVNHKDAYFSIKTNRFENLGKDRLGVLGKIANIEFKEGTKYLVFENKGSFYPHDFFKASCFELVEQTHEVSESFIKELHLAAADYWQKKIEEQFPLLFPKKTIESVLEENDLMRPFYMCYEFQYEIQVEGDIIKIPLPIVNREWTFKAYRLAEKICDIFTRASPSHNESSTCTRFIYITVERI